MVHTCTSLWRIILFCILVVEVPNIVFCILVVEEYVLLCNIFLYARRKTHGVVCPGSFYLSWFFWRGGAIFAAIALKRGLLLVHVVKRSNFNSRFDLIDLFCKSYLNLYSCRPAALNKSFWDGRIAFRLSQKLLLRAAGLQLDFINF
jgi:hypothetical protein